MVGQRPPPRCTGPLANWMVVVAAVVLLLLPVVASRKDAPIDCEVLPESTSLEGFVCPAGLSQWERSHVEGDLAIRHAPLLYHHPLEKYYLTDPVHWAASARVFDRFFSPIEGGAAGAAAGGNATPDREWARHLDAGLALNTFITQLNKTGQESAMLGSPFDDQGRSTARVWYNALPHTPSGGWLVNYNLFYGWNGCLNMAFSSALNKRSVDETIEYYFCPTG
ncbi:hypothetical protein FOA52_009649 [Chlamydomonas sp. UWO 241]|nr:hypothetical protein FOA52_009649 [Chlamydomonas sp. UWO 241]